MSATPSISRSLRGGDTSPPPFSSFNIGESGLFVLEIQINQFLRRKFHVERPNTLMQLVDRARPDQSEWCERLPDDVSQCDLIRCSSLRSADLLRPAQSLPVVLAIVDSSHVRRAGIRRESAREES